MNDARPVDLSAFLPRVTDLIRPRIITIPTGTTYQMVEAPRPAILVSLSPTTVGTIFAMPIAQPMVDTDAIPSTAGYIFLDGVGQWYVRHTSGSSEQFRLIDAGGAGNASLAAASAGAVSENINVARIGGTAQTAFDLTARFAPITMSTQSVNPDIDSGSDEELLAANASRRFLYICNTSTAGQVVSYKFGATAVAGQGFVLQPNQSHSWDILNGVSTAQVRIIASADNASAAFAEGI